MSKIAFVNGNAVKAGMTPKRLSTMPAKMLRMTGVVRKPRTVAAGETAPVPMRCTNGTRMKKTKITWPRSTTAKLKTFSAP